MKKLNIIIMCVLFIITLIDCIRYYSWVYVPTKFDMLFLFAMTLLGIVNYILDELSK